ncbi:MAG: hypothetical protein HDR93_08100, partial [Bacteroides sp.]|nr:hypothetical protein [Bacteroides sp.]
MSEAEMNAYRFGSGKEPTDEMLAQIMHEASVDAKKRHEEEKKRYFEELRLGADEQQAKWAERINKVK